ncbi:hypothetical protein ABIB73_000572 [Bradyrhizobium sp. F1.4.3]
MTRRRLWIYQSLVLVTAALSIAVIVSMTW